MKIAISILVVLAVLFTGCKNPKHESIEETVEVETVITKETKETLGNDPELVEAGKLKNLMAADTEMQLIDVRSAEEFAEGHLVGALNVDINGPNFNEKILTLQRDEPVFLYCRSGGRSARAAKVVSALGYRVYDLDKGIMGWENQNFEVEK